ncbi:MAG: sporulation protein [Acidobacteria bacterium]|nr:sporulation protein [Acidobacteriota bacterium]
MSEHQEATQSSGNTFVERLARQIGISANARLIYGEPVERGGVTVITVAKAAYGFGGGGGKKEDEEGSGGGGGVALTPVGYIEMKNGETRFRPTRDWLALLPAIAAAAPAILLSAWALAKLVRKIAPNNKTGVRQCA